VLLNNFDHSTFIDIGCGAGRVLFMSSKVGFRYSIGIEQSKKLSDLCNQNLININNQRSNMAVVNQDVRNVNFLNLINNFDKVKEINSVVFFLYGTFVDKVNEEILDKVDTLKIFNCYIISFETIPKKGRNIRNIMIRKGFFRYI